jgi:hypothetical protein
LVAGLNWIDGEIARPGANQKAIEVVARDCPHCVLLLGVTLLDDDMAVSGSKRHTRSPVFLPARWTILRASCSSTLPNASSFFQLALRQPVIEGSQRERVSSPTQRMLDQLDSISAFIRGRR